MTDGEDTPENDFAAFEAAAVAGDPATEAKDPEAKEPEPVVDPDEDADDEADPTVNDKADDEEGDKPEKRPRSKPPSQRIAELTAKLRQAERDLETARKPAEAKPEDAPVITNLVAPDPNATNEDGSDKYEFGEADPKYIADMARFEVKKELAEERQKEAVEQSKTKMKEVATTLDAQWQEKAKAGAEKYADFNEVVLESAAAGEWPCPPIVALAISASEQGADIAYHLASNPKEAEELARLSETDPFEAVRRFGRMEARFEAKAEAKPTKLTEAPEPPTHRARGGSGKFEVGADTTDFAAFEAKAKAAARR